MPALPQHPLDLHAAVNVVPQCPDLIQELLETKVRGGLACPNASSSMAHAPGEKACLVELRGTVQNEPLVLASQTGATHRLKDIAQPRPIATGRHAPDESSREPRAEPQPLKQSLSQNGYGWR